MVFQLADLRDCLVEPHQERYRSLFMLIFYLIGINFVDLCGLDGIVDGRVEYRRHKTGRLYSIKVEPEAKKIIESLRGKNHLIFVNDSVKNYKNFTKQIEHLIEKRPHMVSQLCTGYHFKSISIETVTFELY